MCRVEELKEAIEYKRSDDRGFVGEGGFAPYKTDDERDVLYSDSASESVLAIMHMRLLLLCAYR